MSAKTYAGFPLLTPNSVFSTLSGRTGYAICREFEDEDDHIFRTRFQRGESGSGPFMTVRRVVDLNNPSTDGVYDIGVGRGQSSTAIITCGSVDYNVYRYVDVRMAGTSSARRYRVVHRIVTYLPYEYVGPRRVRVTIHTDEYVTDELADVGIDINRAREAASVRDYDYAYYLLNEYSPYSLSGIRTITDNTVTRTPTYFQLDLAPPDAVYLEYYNKSREYLELGILPGTWAMSLETAYIEASKNLPQAATNVAANILEAASLLSSFLSGRWLGNIPTTAREAWLAYRYSYSTTKSDIRDFKETFGRLEDLAQVNLVSTYGSYVRDGINFRVGYEVNTAQIIPTDVSSTLRKFGLQLNALNAWDMIPFSFVVDWFLPVSDVIEYFQDIGACRYEPKDLWWSLTTVRDGYLIYVRLPGRVLSTMPYLQLSKAGQKTIAMRIADTVALFAP